MSNIERFESPDISKFDSPYGAMRGPAERGEWVRYKDHKAKLDEMEFQYKDHKAKLAEMDYHLVTYQKRYSDLNTKLNELEEKNKRLEIKNEQLQYLLFKENICHVCGLEFSSFNTKDGPVGCACRDKASY